MTARELVQRRRAFLSRQDGARDFVLQLRPFLDALGGDDACRQQLDALRRDGQEHREAIRRYDADAVARLVALGADIRAGFSSPDPPTSPDEPVRPWYWAWFDSVAGGNTELEEFALPDKLRNPTVASKLLPFLRGKLQNIANEAERTGEEAALERSSPLWARYNEEERRHEYAVRDLHVAEASHPGWCLSRIEYVIGLLTRRPTASDLETTGGLDFTPWEPVARAANYAVFGTKPTQVGRVDVEREANELVSALRKDVDHLCEDLELRLSTTAPAARLLVSEPAPRAAVPSSVVSDAPTKKSERAVFEDATWESVQSLLPVDALLMTAVKIELRAVRSRLVPLPLFTRVLRLSCEESTYYVGRIGSHTCAVVMSDAGSVGRMGAALTLHDAIVRLSPAFVLSIGIAFGKTQASQQVGDVLVSTMVIPYESERVQTSGNIPRAPHPEAGMVLLNRLRTLDSEDAVPLKIHFGPLLSGEKLVDDANFKETLFRMHPTAIGGEMEAAGIYAAAARNRLEWVVIKAVCDWGDGTKTKEYQDQAATNSSAVMHELLSRSGLERAAFSPKVLPHRRQPADLASGRPPNAEHGVVADAKSRHDGTDASAEPVESRSAAAAYQRLTQRVFQALLSQDSVKNVRVEHDVVLKGVAGEHEVDVYWEFETGGITYRTVVECVAGRDPGAAKTVLALRSVLADLPGQPRGVVVGKDGFGEDTKRYAEAHGIVLYELRPPRDEDWKGFITAVNIKGELLVPKVHGIEFKVDEDWAATELKRCGIASLDELPHVQGIAGAIVIEREDGSALTTVGDAIENHLCPKSRGLPEWREHLFADPAYIASGLPNLPRIRLRGLRASVELVVGLTQDIEVRLEPLVGLILKEVTGENFTMLDAEGRPLEAGEPRPARIVIADNNESDDD